MPPRYYKEKNMRQEEKEIKYRPELAKELKTCLNAALTFYNINYRKAYYTLLSIVCENKNDTKGSELFKKVATCFSENAPYTDEDIWISYKRTMRKEYGVEPLSEARAAYVIYETYKKELEEMRNSITASNLTKMEEYMVKDFFNILLSPTRNSNIQIKEGHTKCWYDSKAASSSDFRRDLENSLEFIEKNCLITIEIFDTPDESERKNDEQEISDDFGER